METSDISAGEEFLGLVHKKEYIELVRSSCQKQLPLDADTITSKKSYEAAIYAVGAAIQAAESGGLAVVRPPGHHAYPDHASGFCLFNNIAIAVQYLVNQGKKVFIVDFDGHCGDGTEFQFYNSDQVLFLSTHQYPAYPGKGFVHETGNGKGKGFTVNVPLPPESADDIYLDSLHTLLPIAKQFNPDMVAVSAGFDAHHSDPLLQLNFSANVYYETGRILKDEFKNIFAVLEGGYNLNYLPKCLFNFVSGINGEAATFSEKRTVSSNLVISEFQKRMDMLVENLKPYWNI
jgi:acetoin utilization deacetylase AcuC-like enzyme